MEMIYCIHSDMRDECLPCLEAQIEMLQAEKTSIINKRIMEAAQEHGYREGEAVMPMIKGKRYMCQCCGAGVFHMHFDVRLGWLYVCNGCGTEYEGKKSA